MNLIVDGYNLMHAAGDFGHGAGPGGLERSRTALLRYLAQALEPELAARTVVVFDASAQRGAPRTERFRGLTVIYAAGYEDADSLIEELIRRHSAPRRLTVVSSDRRLRRAARRRKATSVGSGQWYDQIVKQRGVARDDTPETAKPTTDPTGSELQFWLDQFLSDPDAPSGYDPLVDNPFPPGYAEDLLDDEDNGADDDDDDDDNNDDDDDDEEDDTDQDRLRDDA